MARKRRIEGKKRTNWTLGKIFFGSNPGVRFSGSEERMEGMQGRIKNIGNESSWLGVRLLAGAGYKKREPAKVKGQCMVSETELDGEEGIVGMIKFDEGTGEF